MLYVAAAAVTTNNINVTISVSFGSLDYRIEQLNVVPGPVLCDVRFRVVSFVIVVDRVAQRGGVLRLLLLGLALSLFAPYPRLLLSIVVLLCSLSPFNKLW